MCGHKCSCWLNWSRLSYTWHLRRLVTQVPAKMDIYNDIIIIIIIIIIIKPAIQYMASCQVSLSKHRTSNYMSISFYPLLPWGLCGRSQLSPPLVIVGLFRSKIVASLSTVLHHVNLCPLCLAPSYVAKTSFWLCIYGAFLPCVQHISWLADSVCGIVVASVSSIMASSLLMMFEYSNPLGMLAKHI